jgi:hypothetical protein
MQDIEGRNEDRRRTGRATQQKYAKQTKQFMQIVHHFEQHIFLFTALASSCILYLCKTKAAWTVKHRSAHADADGQ